MLSHKAEGRVFTADQLGSRQQKAGTILTPKIRIAPTCCPHDSGKSTSSSIYKSCKTQAFLLSLSPSLIPMVSLFLFSKTRPSCFPKTQRCPAGWFTSVTAVPGISADAFAVGLPQAGQPAPPVLTLDGLAGVEQVLLFITQHAPVALQALTAVGEGVDGQAGAMHASAERNAGMTMH